MKTRKHTREEVHSNSYNEENKPIQSHFSDSTERTLSALEKALTSLDINDLYNHSDTQSQSDDDEVKAPHTISPPEETKPFVLYPTEQDEINKLFIEFMCDEFTQKHLSPTPPPKSSFAPRRSNATAFSLLRSLNTQQRKDILGETEQRNVRRRITPSSNDSF